ncbi:DUF2971 domain-containing protein [Sulfurimonas sp.]|uniref:DUF2971 domain-containing protein n=1 Tax=Sulfurimonas sp. TaxID=2022749 RepID=UPI0025FB7676|nr:DUF2971 domain-containing protein [Sulfurimonas sp.]
MSKEFYRIRSLESLIGKHKELDNQEIFFQTPEKLNDPMEGFIEFVFNGDKIVWKNFFKHYIICFEWIFQNYIIYGENGIQLGVEYIPIFKTFEELESPEYKQLISKITESFFENSGELVNEISQITTDISKDELLRYLYFSHNVLLEIVQRTYEDQELMPRRKQITKIDINNIKNISKYINAIEKLREEYGHEKVNILHQDSVAWYEKMMLELNCNTVMGKETPNKNFILNFNSHYLEALKKLTYPKVYVASFLENPYNSSTWGNYGENHTGVCLIFKSDKEQLEFSNVLSGDRPITQSLKFKKVNYDSDFKEINFFESFGLLTYQKIYSWYIDESNNESILFDKMFKNEDSWREEFWGKFEKNKLIKTKDWHYEKEYRLTYHRLSDYEVPKEHRKLKYDFNSLKGLIFGIKTPLDKKCEIIEIIKNKCKERNRNDFEFNQAYYCNSEKEIRYRNLNLKFNDTIQKSKKVTKSIKKVKTINDKNKYN